jgi:hypothetical protein
VPRWLVLLLVAPAVAPLVAVVPLVSGGCGTDAVGVSDCKQIEAARCQAAAACPEIPLYLVNHSAGSDVEACIRFYDVACLHGLTVSDPGPIAVNACVAAILGDGGCATVEQPQNNPACSWLAPPDASADVVEAGEAGDAGDGGDASTDGGDGGDASDADAGDENVDL